MIRDVTNEGFTTNELPWKFEAGTPADRRGRRASAPPSTTSSALGMDAVREHEVALTGYALARARPSASATTSRSTARSSPPSAAGCSRFAFDDLHPHDLTQVLDEHGVCVRAGHHCAKPLMRVLGVAATARASFYVYNDERRRRRPGRRARRRRRRSSPS